MNPSTDVGMKFTNSVTGQAKLEKYYETLEKIKTALTSMPTNTSIGIDTSATSKVEKSLENIYKQLTNNIKVTDSFKNKFVETMNKSKNSSDNLNDKLKDTKNNIDKAFDISKITLFGMTIKKVVQNMGKLVDQSAEYLESYNLSQVAFRGNTDAVERLTARLSEMYGLDEAWALRTASNFKQLANAMGLADNVGTQLSKTLTQLSIDLSSLYNTDVDEAASKLQSALAGQTKPIRSFGADITQATLQQTLLANGIDRVVSELTFAEKRLLIVASILQQTDESFGDWGKTINCGTKLKNLVKNFVNLCKKGVNIIKNIIFANDKDLQEIWQKQ